MGEADALQCLRQRCCRHWRRLLILVLDLNLRLGLRYVDTCSGGVLWLDTINE